MAEREQIKKQAPARTEEETIEEVPATSKKGEELKAELDDLWTKLTKCSRRTPRSSCGPTCRKAVNRLKCCRICGELKPLDAFYKMAEMRTATATSARQCNLHAEARAVHGEPRARGQSGRAGWLQGLAIGLPGLLGEDRFRLMSAAGLSNWESPEQRPRVRLLIGG